jgi:serine/threonine protein kinase
MERTSEETLRAEIHVLVGAETVAIYSIQPGVYLVGRDQSCHLPIDAEHVAGMHARLSFYGNRLLIEDLENTGGVFIGGARILLPTPIKQHTEVHLGAARFFFQFDSETREKIARELSDPSLGLESIRSELLQEPYQVTHTLGQGGMGLVLAARDLRIHRSVAMKVLRPGNEFAADKLLRFVSEAQVTGQLEHPNIIPVYQLGVGSDAQVFYTMKHVRGRTLEDVLGALKAGEPETCAQYPLSALLTVFMKVADAVAFAHARGVVHRDLKPANIMIGTFGEVLVMDWGLARRIAEGPLTPDEQVPAASKITLPTEGRFETLDGTVVGTPPFLSPEQARGMASLEVRSDIFVLGIILYNILALRLPMELHDLDSVLLAISSCAFEPLEKRVEQADENGEPPPKLRHCPGGRLPEGLVAIVEKAMQRMPENRYQTVEALQRDIVAYQNGFAPSAERAGFFRQLQLLLGRRRQEALLAVTFLVISQLLLGGFLWRLAVDRRVLRENESALAEKNQSLKSKNQQLEQIVFQLRSTAARNFEDALTQLRQRRGAQALSQINLALVGGADSPKTQAKYLIVRGLANTQLGFYSEAAIDFRQAAQADPECIPVEQMESDLELALEEGVHPAEGWPWEKRELQAATQFAVSVSRAKYMNEPQKSGAKRIKVGP